MIFCIQNGVEQNSTNWREIIETIIAIIGAFAWLPFLIEKFSSSKIYGKIISSVVCEGFVSNGHSKRKDGLLYFFKVSISCINKNFNIKSVDIYIKYKDKNWVKGSIFWVRTNSWNIEGRPKQLILPNDNFLDFINVLEKDKQQFYYVTFIVEYKKTYEDFEAIRFDFLNYKKRKVSFEILRENISNDSILFDDNIWKPFPPLEGD